MNFQEEPILFDCQGEKLLGVVTLPDFSQEIGVLIVVGGPQYRAGSHRQFVLLARQLAASGYPAMRFDYRGLGDSSGEQRNFEAVDLDIEAAIETFRSRCPQLEHVVLWGLCDAAAACLLYWEQARSEVIGGMVLLNPWVRSDVTLARTHIKHYYAQRLLQSEFWHKFFSGQLGIGQAIRGFVGSLYQAVVGTGNSVGRHDLPFQGRMLLALRDFPGMSLIILSGNDYTAKEFLEYANNSSEWRTVLNTENVVVKELPNADHTFSSVDDRVQVERMTIEWLAQTVR